MFTRALRPFRTHRGKRLGAAALALGLVAAPLVVLPTTASATLSGSPFNGANGVLDGHASIAQQDDVGTPDTFAGGVKEDTDCPPMDGGGAPDKSDVLTAWVGNANGVVSGADHTFLYLAWSRPSDEGTATIDFELNSGTESCGTGSSFVKRVAGKDLLFEYDFQGGNTIGVSVRTWTSSNQGGKWGDPVLLPATKAEASISGDQLFGELAVDMTAAGFFQPGVCENFSTASVKSRSSSSSFENQVKDLILPFPIEVTNCGSLKVTKTVHGGAGESFDFSVDCGDIDATFALSDGGQKLIEDIPVGTSCSVSESDPGASNWATTYSLTGGSGLQAGRTASGIAIALGTKTVAFTNTRKVGNLQINKTTTGGAGTFTFSVDCAGDAFDQTVTITNSGSKTISNIPTGTSCTVTEDANSFFRSVQVPENGTVVIDGDGETVSFTNTRKVADLVIQKTTRGGSGTFTFNVDCTNNAFDRAVTITDSGSETISNIPTGTTCTVLEVASPQFDSSSNPANGVVVIDDDGATVSFTNDRKVGDLVIEKLTTGGTGTFTFDVNCDDNRFDQTVTIAGSGSKTIANIPTGTNCTVNELEDPLFDSSSIPSDGTLVIGTGTNTVSFLNVRKTAGLTINKLTNGAGEGDTFTFTFRIDCAGELFDKTVTINNSGSYTLIGIPTGTHCKVTEDAHRLFTSASVPSDGEVTVDNDGESVSFTNTRKVGQLLIAKTTNGGTGTFTFHVDCDGDDFDQTVTISNNGSVTIDGIPTETGCHVTEDAHPWFTSTVVPGNGSATIDTDGETVSFTNTAKPNGISIDKKVNGVDTSSSEPLDVEVGSTLTYTVKVTNSGQVPLSISELSDTRQSDIGSTCVPSAESSLDPGKSVTCTYTMAAVDPGGTSIVYNTAAATGTDIFNRPAGPVDDSTYVHVLSPAIHLDKTGPASAHVGDTITYTLTVTNPGNTPLAAVTVSDPKCDGPAVRATADADGLLSPGEAWTYNCTHVVLAADGASILNTARAEGTDPLGQTVNSTGNHTAVVLRPAISIVKTDSPESVSISGPVTYTYVVTNSGDAVLSNVLVTDDILGAIGTVGQLAPGQSVTFAKTVNVDATTPPRNIGTAVGTDPLGQTVTAADDAVITVVLGAVLAQPELPRTGAPLTAQTWAALAMIEIGIAMALAGRRRRA